jgi:hypothetical protein
MSTVDQPGQHTSHLSPPLRQCVLAVSVLSDVDVIPVDDGVRLPGLGGSNGPSAVIDWDSIREAIGSYPPQSTVARARVESLLRLHRLVIDLGDDAAQHFHAASRVVALPPDHSEHPGARWVCETLRGDALELGIGVHGLLDLPDRTTPVPTSVLRAIGVTAQSWWPRLREHSERMGALSASRLARDGTTGLVRPVGGCDVLALLTSRTLRRHLADGDGAGMRALAVPTRLRGWYDVARIDPAFVRAAWSLTDDHDRGLPVPVLITADSVSLPFSLA